MKILVVEDEPRLAEALAQLLRDGGYQADTEADGPTGLARARSGDYGLAVLDVMLPGLDGFAVMERLEGQKVPVIFLSAMQQVADKVRGLRLGAEDYIAKPFEAIELLARVEVVLRRQGRGELVLEYGGIRQDLGSHTVTRDGQAVALSPKEFELLRVFLQNQDLALGREKLLAMVWGYEYAGESRTVDIHVQRLRQKLGLAERLVTLPRIGYRLEKLP